LAECFSDETLLSRRFPHPTGKKPGAFLFLESTFSARSARSQVQATIEQAGQTNVKREALEILAKYLDVIEERQLGKVSGLCEEVKSNL
jgi:hypothetical protein